MDITDIDSDAYARWSKIRMDRILADYMLRKGYSESAKKLAQTDGIEVYCH